MGALSMTNELAKEREERLERLRQFVKVLEKDTGRPTPLKAQGTTAVQKTPAMLKAEENLKKAQEKRKDKLEAKEEKRSEMETAERAALQQRITDESELYRPFNTQEIQFGFESVQYRKPTSGL